MLDPKDIPPRQHVTWCSRVTHARNARICKPTQCCRTAGETGLTGASGLTGATGLTGMSELAVSQA